jgi:hypothetical protein
MERIRNIQTRDCYYPIYFVKETNFNFHQGYYFFDDEAEEFGAEKGDYGFGYIGPFNTLDDVCKKQHQYYVSIMSL